MTAYEDMESTLSKLESMTKYQIAYNTIIHLNFLSL